MQPVDPNKDGTFEIRLGSTFEDAPRQTFHALKCILLWELWVDCRQFQACGDRLWADGEFDVE